MKLWLINHYAAAPNEPGGTRHHGLAGALIGRGHEVTVIAANFSHPTRSYTHARSKDQYEYIGGVPFLWLRTPAYGGNARRLWNMIVFALRVLLGRTVAGLPKPDVIVGSTLTLFAAFAALRFARRLRVPFVLEVRDVWPQTLIDFGISRWHPVVLLFGALERYLYRHADAIITLLPAAVEHIRARGAKDQPILWLPNGVDLATVPSLSPPRAHARFEVVYAGSHAAGDALATVLDAAAVLQQRKRHEIRFRLIGNGSAKEKLQQRALELGLDNVSFEPPVTKQRIWPILAGADALLATLQASGLYRFGMSLNKLYDYMAAGRPVVFAAKSANDPVRESQCGIVVPPENPVALADAIEKLANMSPEARWEMGLRGRRHVEQHHDFSKLAGKLEALLLQSLNSTALHPAGSH